MEFKVVPRPERPSGPLTEALKATVQSGQAIEISCNGDNARVVRLRLINRNTVFKQIGLRVRTRVNADKSAVIAWCEPLSEGH